ncbi:hypothetical protein EWM64_g7569, partial [Hericium alpestre]
PVATSSTSKGKGKDVKPSEAELEAFEKALEKLEEWEQKQYIIKQQIFSMITDSLLLRIQVLDHAHEVWNTVCREFEAKTMMVQIDLRRRLQDTRCDDGTDIRTHFDGLLRMKEELSGIGTTLQDMDFSAIIMSSLPKSFDPVLSSMLSAAPRLEKKASDRTALLTAGDTKKKCSQGNGKKDGTKCPNCGKGYHTIANCWSKGGGKEGQGPERKGSGSGKESWDRGSANIAADLETNFAFSALAMATPQPDLTRCIDTGASHHYSPFRSEFIDFHQIAPKPIVAADQRIFFVTGEGNVIVNFPNGETSTRIMLRNVLYTPSIAFMLVSISRINESHFSTTFHDGQCQIRSPNGMVIARIPRTNNLYKFVCPTDKIDDGQKLHLM